MSISRVIVHKRDKKLSILKVDMWTFICGNSIQFIMLDISVIVSEFRRYFNEKLYTIGGTSFWRIVHKYEFQGKSTFHLGR